MSDTPKIIEVGLPDDKQVFGAFIHMEGPVIHTFETDVVTLQRMLREMSAAHQQVLKRLIKARRQKNEARAEVAKLQEQIRKYQLYVDAMAKEDEPPSGMTWTCQCGQVNAISAASCTRCFPTSR